MKDRVREALQLEAQRIDAPFGLKARIRREIRLRARRRMWIRYALRLLGLALMLALMMLAVRTCL